MLLFCLFMELNLFFKVKTRSKPAVNLSVGTASTSVPPIIALPQEYSLLIPLLILFFSPISLSSAVPQSSPSLSSSHADPPLPPRPLPHRTAPPQPHRASPPARAPPCRAIPPLPAVLRGHGGSVRHERPRRRCVKTLWRSASGAELLRRPRGGAQIPGAMLSVRGDTTPPLPPAAAIRRPTGAAAGR